MKLTTRRNIAILLILIGLVALGFGLWILWQSFFSKPSGDLNLPGKGDLVTTSKDKPEPKIIELPTTIEGTSTLTATDQASDITEAINKARDVIGRMGSGMSQDGFKGYEDALLYGTQRFKTYVLQEQQRMRIEHPAEGPAYGMTTRIVSADLVRGQNGGDEIVVKIQSQVTIDAGDRGKPMSVYYEEKNVTLTRQVNGEYLVDYMETKSLN
ncbi:hypothetical protein KKG46_02930 [Patescibacteria group bacterium]|nr:hypothetical protein [Patescibacteria group bacterium]